MIAVAATSTGFLECTARYPVESDVAIVSAKPTRYKSSILPL